MFTFIPEWKWRICAELFGTDHVGLTGTLKIAPIRKEIEFFELEPTLPEEDLLQPPL